jgi:hypothetical protein
MLVSSFNLSESFNYTPYLFKKTVQITDPFFLYMDPGERKDNQWKRRRML